MRAQNLQEQNKIAHVCCPLMWDLLIQTDFDSHVGIQKLNQDVSPSDEANTEFHLSPGVQAPPVAMFQEIIKKIM
jgi:hypothetical protein